MTLLEHLQALPVEWGLVAVDGRKRAYQDEWQRHPLTQEQAAAELRSGNARAIGVAAGPASGGLLFVDHDGISATEQLERLGLPVRDLPNTVAVTSGKDGRFQLIYRVPEQYWSAMRGRRVFKTGKLDADGKAENLDLRWAGHYSVVIGAHPETSGYRWLAGRSPADLPIAEAPIALIELLLRDPEPDPAPLLQTPLVVPASLADPLPFLEFIAKDSRELIESGGTPGAWNDDHLKLALDLVGTEAWIQRQGYRSDLTAREAFQQHIAAARPKAKDFDERKAWHRFDGALKRDPVPSTPEDKLIGRLAYHTRPKRPPAATPPKPSASAGPARARDTASGDAPAPVTNKPQKLDAAELLAFLRVNAERHSLRYNIFTQNIEFDGRPIEGLERFYLVLAEKYGYKVTKDLAVDCVTQIANENKYDPVAEYLTRVAETIKPCYIGGLASAYLRPEDGALAQPTLYDHMLRCTLIGAVKRAFEPGCKHDTACVLAGDQGARKSSFWAALGGPFFSDALRDIGSKDDLMVLHRSWIQEWAELDHITNRKHAGQVKAFLSQSSDVFRQPYGRTTESFPRRGIIVGSTNRSTGLLVDDTGNRRFWIVPITCTEANPIDTATLVAERDAIWSGAVHAYRAGELNYLPPELSVKVTQENEGYQLDNPWQQVIQDYLAAPANGGVPITSELLLTKAIQKPVERQTRADQMAVADILKSLGFRRSRITAGTQRTWVWLRD